jgi:type I restriction enzyme S subunit
MGGRYQAYPEYKDSGVEWFGEVPEHWEVKKLKYIANISPSNVDKKSKREEVPVQLCNYTDVYYNDVISASDNYMKATATEEEVRKFTLLAGDTIVTKDSEDTEDIAIPAFVPKDLDGVVCGYHLALIRPYEERYGALIKRNFEATYVRAYMGTRANGLTRYGLGTYALSNSFFVQPPPQEAIDIANFLDHETAKIDTLIEKQQQLIALLKEKRQAVISHAVTKGLNPDVPMKDSGVEWLGEVPEHWDLTEIRFIAGQMGGGTPSKDIVQYWSGDIPWVSPKDMKVDYIKTAEDKITMDAVNNSSAKLLPAGCILVVVRGMILLHSIPVALTTQEVTINQDMKAFILREKISGEFFLFLLKGLRDYILELVETSAHGTKCLRTEQFERMKIALPERAEQDDIVEKIKQRLSKMDLLLGKAEKAIELLYERRTALISAAVTGKIDVRNWQPPNDKAIQ